ncbi:hypothetical protein PPYR_06743 [Photinus pyralis]|uniref:C2 domain-containing protein n=3 Tax=Photinus pyralis TaxID=7054 RepID=A0A5N4ANK3_PHOPY|nr:synaptotagmin-12 [Photinus pyralis]XP_031340488.1 synaptotagmin-12 [Photinus pyralis]KAB0798863.1 hypothetical protein PPYR_06743 [Photinus pyralis]
MERVEVAFTVICISAFILLLLVALYHWSTFWTWLATWILSTREEKVGLTRSKVYNANGYLVNSDSDIHLDAIGTFKRFDSVDRDFKITLTTTSLGGQWNKVEEDETIPPQPLRPAPTSVPTSPKTTKTPPLIIEENVPAIRNEESEPVLTIAIPRPKSSISVAELAAKSQFPVCITPPPSPAHPLSVSKYSIGYHQPHSSPNNVQSDEQEVITATLKRAISCDSVCSDSSVALGDLEEPNVTGYLCLGLEYDSELSDLIVNVLEAKDLIGSSQDDNPIDSYVKIYLLPDKATSAQTKLYRYSNSPSYKERFSFPLRPREQSQKSLCFHVYSLDNTSHTLLGEGEIRLTDISLRQPVTTWVTLTDTGQKGTEFGEVMFSLSYLPTAERLTVVVVKARNLKFQNDRDAGDPFVKVYLLHHGKKVHKKKTSTKRGERSPIFNESMIFSVPAHTLQTIQLRLTVAENINNEHPTRTYSIGHVIIGAQASGRSLNHWNQMLTALRKPVAMWHPLRK